MEGVTNDVLLLLNSLSQRPVLEGRNHMITTLWKKTNDTSLLNTRAFHTFLLQDSEVTVFPVWIVHKKVALSHVRQLWTVSFWKNKGDKMEMNKSENKAESAEPFSEIKT